MMHITVTVTIVFCLSTFWPFLFPGSYSHLTSITFPPPLRHSSSRVCSLNDSSLNGDGENCCLNGALETGLCSNDARPNQEESSSPLIISMTSKVGISFVLLISG